MTEPAAPAAASPATSTTAPPTLPPAPTSVSAEQIKVGIGQAACSARLGLRSSLSLLTTRVALAAEPAAASAGAEAEAAIAAVTQAIRTALRNMAQGPELRLGFGEA